MSLMTTVKSRRKRQSPPKTLQHRLDDRIAALNSYIPSVLNALDTALSACSTPRTILCLGLGDLENKKSLDQLVLLNALASHLSISKADISFYDPAFEESTVKFLQEDLEYRILQPADMEADKHLVIETPTLLYMPHCPRSLYEALLAANQATLSHIVLIGNDLPAYIDNEIRQSELDKVPLIQDYIKICQCIALSKCEEHMEAFNDTAIQYIVRQEIDPLEANSPEGANANNVKEAETR